MRLADNNNQGSSCSSEERLRFAVEAADLGTWDYAIGAGGKLNWSARCHEMTELPSGPIDFDSFLGTIHPDDRERVRAAAEEAMRPGGSDDYSVAYRVVGIRTGRIRWVAARGRVLRDRAGQAVRFGGIALDITEQKETEQQLRELTARLKESNRELEQFASVVSHDLREPLRTISSFLKLLSQQHRAHLTTSAQEYIDFALSGAESLREVVDGLRELADLGTNLGEFEAYELNDVVAAAEGSLRDKLSEHAACLVVGCLPRVQCHPVLLQRVFRRLILLALHATVDAGPLRIHIAAADRGVWWEIAMQLQCRAVPSLAGDRDFDPLATAVPGQPDALGVCLCKKVIEKHGGRIWLGSGPEREPIFRFTISKQK